MEHALSSTTAFTSRLDEMGTEEIVAMLDESMRALGYEIRLVGGGVPSLPRKAEK
jgi:hypothetical protein